MKLVAIGAGFVLAYYVKLAVGAVVSRRRRSRASVTSAIVGLVLAVALGMAPPASAQVPCVRHERSFSCADGTALSIYDEPRLGFGPRGRVPARPHSDRDGGNWWKDDRSVHGPDGQVCVVHGNHVHCGGSGVTDQP